MSATADMDTTTVSAIDMDTTAEAVATKAEIEPEAPVMGLELIACNLFSFINFKPDDLPDNCSICMNSLLEICMGCRCESGAPITKEQCPDLGGECGHIFHYHCIHTYHLKQKSDPKCPLCGLPWANGGFS